jgi:hypothetical protein
MKYLLAHTPQAGPVNITYSSNAEFGFNFCLDHITDQEKSDAVMWLRDEGFMDKISGKLAHDTPFDQCLFADLINSIKELEYNEN